MFHEGLAIPDVAVSNFGPARATQRVTGFVALGDNDKAARDLLHALDSRVLTVENRRETPVEKDVDRLTVPIRATRAYAVDREERVASRDRDSQVKVRSVGTCT